MKTIFCFLTFLIFLNSLRKAWSVAVVGKETLKILLNGTETSFMTALIEVSADRDELVLGSDEDSPRYTLDSSWSFFALKPEREYALRTWQTTVNCGCHQQVCGYDCPQTEGDECYAVNLFDEPPLCMLSTKCRGFCGSLNHVGQTQNYTLYSLKHISTIALTSYGGPGSVFQSPGFTIHNRYQDQKYSISAMIAEVTPREQVDLLKYRYAESEGRIITSEEFLSLDAKPSWTVNFDAATCPEDGQANLPIDVVRRPLNATDRNVFHAYTILRTPKISKLSTLFRANILTASGVLEWDEKSAFTFLDPCNQQFLTLEKDQRGNFFVQVPQHQRLLQGDIFCVAINDVVNTQYDLVLYEIKNGSSFWKASNRFVGLLSRDYLEKLQLQITTTTDLTADLAQPFLKSLDIETDQDIGTLKVNTNFPLNCQIYLSPQCLVDFTTSKDRLYFAKALTDCGALYELAGYNCQGHFGTFFPPSNLVESPITGWTENTTIQDFTVHNVKSVNLPDNKPLGRMLLHWITYWSRSNWFEKAVTLFIIISIFMIFGYLIYKLSKLKKSQEFLPIQPEEISVESNDNEENSDEEPQKKIPPRGKSLAGENDDRFQRRESPIYVRSKRKKNKIDMFSDFYDNDIDD